MIEVENLVKEYESPGEVLRVLDGVSFSLRKGESAAVVGPSGSGKSTLLNILGAMDRATSGSVRHEGEEVGNLDEKAASRYRNRKLGFIFQSHHLLPQLTVLENVLVPRLAEGWEESAEETRKRAADLIERVGLGERMTHRPAQLSGGEKQRVAVARALVNEPGLVLADEPTGALDGETGNRVAELLLELQAEKKVSLLVVSHDLKLAARFGRIMRLDAGKLLEVE